MDSIKVKLALSRLGRAEPRFYAAKNTRPQDDMEKDGILPAKSDFLLALPSMDRKENITLLGAATKYQEVVSCQIKWRPHKESGLVTVLSRLVLVLSDDEAYEYSGTETYEPVESTAYPGFITQYGSEGSSIKLIVGSPYRNMRLTFCGSMRSLSNPEQVVFARLGLVIRVTCQKFDFYCNFNQDYFKQCYFQQKKLTCSLDDALKKLQLTDRHEQHIFMTGDCIIEDANKSRTTRTFPVSFGWHIRHFIEDHTPSIQTKRLLLTLTNGQVFHVALNKLDADELMVGYTCFSTTPHVFPIQQPPQVEWESISEKLDTSSKFKVENQDCVVEGEVEKSPASSYVPVFDVKAECGAKGRVWILVNDAIEDVETLHQINKSRDHYIELVKEGKLLPSKKQLCSLMLPEVRPLVVRLDDQKCMCPELVGGKSSSLAQLNVFGKTFENTEYMVPVAFMLSRYAYDNFLDLNAPLKDSITKLEELISDGLLDKLEEQCSIVRKITQECSLPEDLVLQLGQILETHYGDKLDETLLAVRSSSWGEDEENMSAAGQLSTVLNVKGLKALTDAILECYASKFSLANVEYKRQRGLRPSLPMAVAIQEMVQCDKAGVLFTCDPTTGNDTCILMTANYGLGESVVSGQADPDSIVVRRNGEELKVEEVKIGQKLTVIDNSSGEAHYDRSRCCLSDEECLKLAKVGLRVSGFFKTPRDIEWGFKDGQLYLFQSRPVTGLNRMSNVELLHEGDMPKRSENDFATRANIGEVMPFTSTPLTSSYFLKSWNCIFANYVNLLGCDVEFVAECSNDFFIYCNHPLLSIRNTPLFPMCGGERPLVTRALEIAMFGREMGDLSEILEASRGVANVPYPFHGFKYEKLTFAMRVMPVTLIEKEKRIIRRQLAILDSMEQQVVSGNQKLADYYNILERLVKYVQKPFLNHITIVMFNSFCNTTLCSFLSKYCKDPVELFSAISKILAHSPDVISAQIPQRVASIAKLIVEQGEEESKKFAELEPKKALEYLKTEASERIAKEYHSFIDTFGHRCYGEFEISMPAWRQDQEEVVKMIQRNCRGTIQPKKGHLSADEIIDSLNYNLTTKDRLYLKHYLIPKSQASVTNRERTKDCLVLVSYLMRRATRMLAKEMRRQHLIPDEELFFYLLFEEVACLVRSPQPTIVMQATQRRNLFKSTFKEPWVFDEIIKGPPFLPKHLQVTQELSEAELNAPKLIGTPASSGRVQGKVCLVKNYMEIDKVRPGQILVTHSTDIAFSPVFPLITGIVTEVGGLISHGAVVAREYGLPSLLAVVNVMEILEDGEEIILDADKATITRISKITS